MDIIKISDEEVELITGCTDLNSAVEYLLNQGIQIAIVTRGSKGAFVATKEGCVEVPGCEVKEVVDTTGAGDSFCGAMLFQLSSSNKHLSEITMKELEEYTIKDALGIHARPAGMLVKVARQYESKILISKGEKRVDATKLMAIMSMGIKQGDTIFHRRRLWQS